MHSVLRIAFAALIGVPLINDPAPSARLQVPDRTMKDVSAIATVMSPWPSTICGTKGCVKAASCQEDPDDQDNSLMVMLVGKHLAILDFAKNDKFTIDVGDGRSLSVDQINDDGTSMTLNLDPSLIDLLALDANVARSCVEAAKFPDHSI